MTLVAHPHRSKVATMPEDAVWSSIPEQEGIQDLLFSRPGLPVLLSLPNRSVKEQSTSVVSRSAMCGICGELRFDVESPDLGAIGRMSGMLARRGPDHTGTFTDGPLAFGHRRLAITDLSASAHQPMVDSALNLALVFNGTIYNYRELRAELVAMGYAFLSGSDTEVILKAYHAWGESCVQRFLGMVFKTGEAKPAESINLVTWKLPLLS